MTIDMQETASPVYNDDSSSVYYIDKWGDRENEFMICGEYGRRVSRLRLYSTIEEAQIALMLFRKYEVK